MECCDIERNYRDGVDITGGADPEVVRCRYAGRDRMVGGGGVRLRLMHFYANKEMQMRIDEGMKRCE